MSEWDMRRPSDDPAPPEELMDYAEAKRLAVDPDPAVRGALAARADVQPEVLVYLAEDEEPAVRRALAENEYAPRHADVLLARDDDDEVRVAISKKIARLAPQLGDEQRDWLRQLTVEVLEQVARDQLPRVRKILAHEIRHLDSVPRKLVQRLARDVEIAVCGPILQFSPLLTDDDLLEIIRSEPVQGALNAVARRERLGARPADAIVETGNESAICDLLANGSAQIKEDTLDRIIDDAPSRRAWHRPLVRRRDLSHRAVRRVAQFVTAALLAELEQRHGLDPETTSNVAAKVNERLSADGLNEEGIPADRARAAYDANKLDDSAFLSAADRGDREFIVHALALKTKIATATTRSILDAQVAKTIVALCWKAGLAMRTAIQIQLKVARVTPTEVVNAREGIYYPFSGAEMRETLRLLAN